MGWHQAPLLWRAIRSFPPLLLVAAVFLASADAQQVLQPNALPECALNCALLNQAQDACVPPAAPRTNQATYVSCYCQSAYLSSLYNSPNNICDTECANDPAALKQIQSWYTGLCQASAAPPPVTTIVAGGPTTLTSSVATASGTSLGTSSGSVDDGSSGSWISEHWQWVLFLVIICLAIIGLTFLLMWLKKRHRRRRDARTTNMAAPESYNPVIAQEQSPASSQPQMTTMSGANGSDTAIPHPPLTKASRTASLRHSVHSFTASRDSVVPATTFGSMGRSRSGSRPGSGLTSPPPVVWGPHQSQAHSRGYGYNDSEVEVPSPVVGRPQSGNFSSRGSWGPQGAQTGVTNLDVKGMSTEALEEEEEEDERPHTANGPVTHLAEGVRRKLSKRRA